MYKKPLSYLLIISILLGSFGNLYATTQDRCNNDSGYKLYECRKKNICEEFSAKKIIFNTEKTEEQRYLELEEADQDFLKVNKKKYRENMNSIYACAVIQAQMNALTSLAESGLTVDAKVSDKIETRINDRLKNLQQRGKALECSFIETKELFNKLAVLQQTTHEICKYINYLDYLDDYSNTLGNIIEEDTNVLSAINISNSVKGQIEAELNHSIKVFPLAYTAYAQYENFIAIHFVLELIREDFIIFRKRLQQVLLPLNQVLYKVHNSMQTN